MQGSLTLSIRTPANDASAEFSAASVADRRHDREHGINTARDAPHVIRELNADHSNLLQDRMLGPQSHWPVVPDRARRWRANC
jgi:hypothetical protein